MFAHINVFDIKILVCGDIGSGLVKSGGKVLYHLISRGELRLFAFCSKPYLNTHFKELWQAIIPLGFVKILHNFLAFALTKEAHLVVTNCFGTNICHAFANDLMKFNPLKLG